VRVAPLPSNWLWISPISGDGSGNVGWGKHSSISAIYISSKTTPTASVKPGCVVFSVIYGVEVISRPVLVLVRREFVYRKCD
jgi:hypothetical protein